MLRTKIGKSSRLFIYILVIQDHIESVGKPILLKGDEVLLDDLVAQVLSDIAPKPSATFSIQICPNPKFQLGPTDISYPEPTSSFGLSHSQNPNKLDPPIWILVPPRLALPTFCCLVAIILASPNCNWYHRDGLATLCCLIASLWSHRVAAIGATETWFFPSHSTLVHPSCFCRSHQDS